VLAKEETENGVISVLQTTDCATVLRATIIVRERGQSSGSRRIYRFKADSMGYNQEIQDAWNPLPSFSMWTPLQANADRQAPRHVLLPAKLGDGLQKLLTIIAC